MSSVFGANSPSFPPNEISFTYDPEGNRKYLTLSERRRFIAAADASASPAVRTFCLTLLHTGARLSEVMALTPRQIDLEARVVVIRSLKKRRRKGSPPVYRAVPLPESVLRDLVAVHDLGIARNSTPSRDVRIWPWCRTTAWKRIKEVMKSASIVGVQASPKGLRHGFAVGALVAGVPDTNVMRWLGHARLETTMIYTDAVGAEAHMIAERMWEPLLVRKEE